MRCTPNCCLSEWGDKLLPATVTRIPSYATLVPLLFNHEAHMSVSPLTSVPADVNFPNTASPDAVGRQMEGLFASLLLKELRNTGGEGGLFGGDSSDVMGGMFDQYMGQAIADAGGLGLRDYLSAQARALHEGSTTTDTL